MLSSFCPRILALALLLSFWPVTAAAAANSLIERVQKLEKSLVGIKTVYVKTIQGRAGLKRVSYERNGAGVIIDASGVVATNTHIIANAPHIFVVLHDGTRMPAQVAYISPDYDFSFLKIKPSRALVPVVWGDSSSIRLGQDVVTVGSSELNHQSIMAGQVVSVLQSHSKGSNEFIELNLNLHKGDSGVAVFNGQGQLLGMVMGRSMSQERSSLAIVCDRIREQYLHYLRKQR